MKMSLEQSYTERNLIVKEGVLSSKLDSCVYIFLDEEG